MKIKLNIIFGKAELTFKKEFDLMQKGFNKEMMIEKIFK